MPHCKPVAAEAVSRPAVTAAMHIVIDVVGALGEMKCLRVCDGLCSTFLNRENLLSEVNEKKANSNQTQRDHPQNIQKILSDGHL